MVTPNRRLSKRKCGIFGRLYQVRLKSSCHYQAAVGEQQGMGWANEENFLLIALAASQTQRTILALPSRGFAMACPAADRQC